MRRNHNASYVKRFIQQALRQKLNIEFEALCRYLENETAAIPEPIRLYLANRLEYLAKRRRLRRPRSNLGGIDKAALGVFLKAKRKCAHYYLATYLRGENKPLARAVRLRIISELRGTGKKLQAKRHGKSMGHLRFREIALRRFEEMYQLNKETGVPDPYLAAREDTAQELGISDSELKRYITAKKVHRS